MKCDSCDKEATVFLTKVVDHKMQQVNLCCACSMESGVNSMTGFKLAGFLEGKSAVAPKAPTLENEVERLRAREVAALKIIRFLHDWRFDVARLSGGPMPSDYIVIDPETNAVFMESIFAFLEDREIRYTKKSLAQ